MTQATTSTAAVPDGTITTVAGKGRWPRASAR